MAELGGSKDLGVIYKMTPAGKISVLHNFTGYPSDGALPYGILTQGNDGSFYGITYEGGTLNQGTIFKVSAAGTYTLLYSFSYANGVYDAFHPVAGLALGTDGNFYGVAESGGTDNAGAIFKVTTSGTETVLYSFVPGNVCNGFTPKLRWYSTPTENSMETPPAIRWAAASSTASISGWEPSPN